MYTYSASKFDESVNFIINFNVVAMVWKTISYMSIHLIVSESMFENAYIYNMITPNSTSANISM